MPKVTEDIAKDWVRYDEKFLKDRFFREIFDFYILCCPKQGASSMGLDFNNCFGDINSQELLDYFLVKIKMKKDRIYVSDSLENMSTIIEEAGLKDSFYKCKTETIAIYSGKREDVIINFLYAIRCSLAHGRFAMRKHRKERILVLENYHNKCVKARIILKMNTILVLKKVLLGGVGMYKQYIRHKNIQEIKKIKKVINKSKYTSKEQIRAKLNYNYDYIKNLCEKTNCEIIKNKGYYNIK